MNPFLMKSFFLSVILFVTICIGFSYGQDLPPRHKSLHIITFRCSDFGQITEALSKHHGNVGSSYQVLNPNDSIVFYRIYQQSGKMGYAKFFFGTRGMQRIQPLTLENLKVEFGGEKEFLLKLSILAKNDLQLIKYREAINRLYVNGIP
jgi:hypothetical protein